MTWRALGVAALVVALVGLLAYGFTTNPRAIPSPLIGQPAPAFTLALFDGERLSLQDLRGKVVVLNIWASWCVPCREEAPLLEQAWRMERGRGVVFVGINIQDRLEEARAFLREFNVTYPNGPDPGGRIAIDYGVYGIPETFVIDRQGQIVAKHVGAIGPETLARRLAEAERGITSPEERTAGYRSVR